MKRSLLILSLIGGLTATSQATVDVVWTIGGAVANENATPANVASEIVPAGAVAQLIWAGPNNVADRVDPNNLGGGLLGGDDQLLDDQPFAQAGGFGQPTQSDSHDVPGSTGNNSFVYSRVFNANSLAGASYYYDTPLVETPEATPGLPGVPVDITGNLGDNDFIFNGVPVVVTDLPVIPEPNTLAFLGLGGLLLLAIRRFRG